MTVTTLFDDTEISSRPAISNPVAAAVEAVTRAVVAWRAERARELALQDLLGMDPHRLCDLGITAYDVHEALQNGRSAR
jgi:uncharacterized protein YjiS (DUF1127 family)